MIDTDKEERRREAGLFNKLGCIDFDVVDNLLAEVKRLRKELKEAKDVIQYALDRVGNDDDAKRVFEDFLEVIE